MNFLRRIILAQERRNYHPYSFLLFCIFTGLMRGILELFLHNIQIRNTEIVGFIPFYVSLGLLLREMLARLTTVSRESIEKSLVMGIFLGLFPPLFDLFLPASAPIFYGYYFLWDFANIPWLGYNPHFNFPAGECLTIWLSILFSVAYVYVKTQNILRTLLAFIFAYAIFLSASSIFPMLLFRISQGVATSVEATRAIDAVRLQNFLHRLSFWQAMLAVLIIIGAKRSGFLHTLRRIPHGLPFLSLTVLGATMVKAPVELMLLAVAGLFAIIVVSIWQNDFFDFRDDGRSEPPISKADLQSLTAVSLVAVLFLFFQNQRSSIMILVALVAAILYNYPFYRARNSFPSNIKIEGIWGLSAFLTGALLDTHAAQNGTIKVSALLVFAGWSSVSVWKDLKDFEADQKAGVSTLFTLLHKKGVSLESAKIGVRITLSVFFLTPPVILAFTANLPASIALLASALLPITCLWIGSNRRIFVAGLFAVSINICTAVFLLQSGVWSI
jgi:hypothetical protein